LREEEGNLEKHKTIGEWGATGLKEKGTRKGKRGISAIGGSTSRE